VVPARTTAAFVAQLQADATPIDPAAPPFFCHDGTERPVARPKDDEDRKSIIAAKKKDHTIKNVVIVDATGAIRFLSATYAGRVHDKHMPTNRTIN